MDETFTHTLTTFTGWWITLLLICVVLLSAVLTIGTAVMAVFAATQYIRYYRTRCYNHSIIQEFLLQHNRDFKAQEREYAAIRDELDLVALKHELGKKYDIDL